MSIVQKEDKTIQNMKDAGCSDDTISCFLRCYQTSDTKGELKVLAQHRQYLLDELHGRQKEIDCLDYLIYQIQKEGETNE